jgi:hypothetical protein
MIFQSKYRKYVFQVEPRIVKFVPGYGMQVEQAGLAAVFHPKHKTFDSLAAQKELGWTDEERIKVENKMLSAKSFGSKFFLLPGQKLTEEQMSVMRVKPAVVKRFCVAVGIQDGRVIQCQNEPEFGKDYCKDHDPDEAKIVRGSVKQRTD